MQGSRQMRSDVGVQDARISWDADGVSQAEAADNWDEIEGDLTSPAIQTFYSDRQIAPFTMASVSGRLSRPYSR